MQYYLTIFFSSLLVTVSGHTYLESPAPFRGKSNPNTKNVDFDNMAPLVGAGAFPCKGYHTAALADPTGEGKATATWKTGEQASFTFSTGAKHEGGSCQAALSYDSGAKWTVIHSFESGCPMSALSFTVPADAPAGKNVLGAWTWFNKVGNREMYMNCFSVDIEQGSGGSPAVPFASRPDMFVANIGTNTCKVLDGKQVSFPNPGPDVTGKGDADSTSGDCGAAAGGSPPAGKEPAPAPAPAPAPVPAPAPAPAPEPEPKSSIVPVPVSSATSASSAAGGSSIAVSPTGVAPLPSLTTITLTMNSTLAGSASAPPGSSSPPQSSAASSGSGPAASGGSTPIAGSSGAASPTGRVSIDRSCGGAKRKTCSGANCCSSGGYCGTSPLHCGAGCQPAFGKCAAPKARGRSVRISWKN